MSRGLFRAIETGERGVDCGEGSLGFRRGLDAAGECGDFRKIVDCMGFRKSLDAAGECGLLIAVKGVWDFARL